MANQQNRHIIRMIITMARIEALEAQFAAKQKEFNKYLDK
jgi:hypothetical protein